ncbi:MAG: hypothetical protein Q7V57_11090 [Actinomycetota bacterium]|nr:hypothetical protein [Actinomycetota bacterium]
MSARADYPVLAATADLLPARPCERYGPELRAVLEEIDGLRSRTGVVSRIEALRARAQVAEADADRLARALALCTGMATRPMVRSALELHVAAIRERVA